VLFDRREGQDEDRIPVGEGAGLDGGEVVEARGRMFGRRVQSRSS
jgi:hypothetical protein